MPAVTPFVSGTERAVVAGATGAIGRHCIHLLVRDPRVLSVTALIRNDIKSAEFYGLDPHRDDMNKLVHLRVDYEQNVAAQLHGYTFSVGISCLGFDPEMVMASACARCGVSRWSYLSGKYVRYEVNEKNHITSGQIRDSDVLGNGDNLKSFAMINTVKPGIIVGRPSRFSGLFGTFDDALNAMSSPLSALPFAVHRDDVAKSMVYAVLYEEQRDRTVYDNDDIKLKAKHYEQVIDGADLASR